MSADTPTVVQALAAVMGDVQAISKDQRVTEGPARFSFRGVDDVMQAVGPALRKRGVIFAPSRVVSVNHERYTTAKGSSMDGVTVIVEYTITGPVGDVMTAAAAGQAADSGDKAVPKAMSVAFRTVLLQALCIPTDEPDPDTQVHERAPQQMEDPGPLRTLIDAATSKQELAGVGAQINRAHLGDSDRQALRDAYRDRMSELNAAEFAQQEVPA